MYVADYSNNRVLAWRNPASLTKGNQADLVIGQRDFVSTLNGAGHDCRRVSRFPSSVAVDSAGNLYVLDTGNNRIVRYPNPFNQTTSPLSVDLVIGQKTQSSGNMLPMRDSPSPPASRWHSHPGGSVFASRDRSGCAGKPMGSRCGK